MLWIKLPVKIEIAVLYSNVCITVLLKKESYECKNYFKFLRQSASAQRVLEAQRNLFNILLQYTTLFRGYEVFTGTFVFIWFHFSLEALAGHFLYKKLPSHFLKS